MFKILKLNKPYEEVNEKLTNDDVNNDDVVFSKELLEISNYYNMVSEDVIKELYLLYEDDDEDISNNILKLLMKEFNINDIKNYEYIEKVHLNNNIIIKLFNTINDNIIIDYIGKLTLCYDEVYLVNCFLDNPFNNIFYVVCKNKNNNDISNIKLNTHDYMTNINENKHDIYLYLYTCYYSTMYILQCYFVNKGSTIIKTLNLYKSKYKSYNYIK